VADFWAFAGYSFQFSQLKKRALFGANQDAKLPFKMRQNPAGHCRAMNRNQTLLSLN
jgi:hypothetical protein